jgi:hypothetical protein
MPQFPQVAPIPKKGPNAEGQQDHSRQNQGKKKLWISEMHPHAF